MKLIRSILVTTFAALVPISGSAQTTPAGRTPAPVAQRPAVTNPAMPPNTGVIADGKIAIIDTDAFADPKTGITRLVTALEAVNRTFKPRSDELQRLRAQYDQIGKDIEATRNVADQKTLAVKVDQAETLKKDIERKTQDAQSAYQKSLREATEPVYKDINPALQAFARQRGVNVIFDASKLSEVMLIVNDSVDITRAFIADYNQRNPGTPAKP